jgi:hypothetical protein
MTSLRKGDTSSCVQPDTPRVSVWEGAVCVGRGYLELVVSSSNNESKQHRVHELLLGQQLVPCLGSHCAFSANRETHPVLLLRLVSSPLLHITQTVKSER